MCAPQHTETFLHYLLCAFGLADGGACPALLTRVVQFLLLCQMEALRLICGRRVPTAQLGE